MPPVSDDAPLDQRRAALLELVRRDGYRRFEEPITLASGELSHDFVDAKIACATGPSLRLACEVMAGLARERGVAFDAAGGLTLGADPFAHGIALVADVGWFTIRKAPKGRGTNQRIEGYQLSEGDRVLLVDDVVTTGGSIRDAYGQVRAVGAEVVLATTLVDRGEQARTFFDHEGVPYAPVFDYRDLDIAPVGATRG